MKILVITTIFCLCCMPNILAQSVVSVKGKIVSSDFEKPLAGVSVQIKNTNLICKTNTEGIFIVENVPAGSHLLQITFEGYQSQHIPIAIFEKKEYDLGTIYLDVSIPELTDTSVILLSDDDLSDDGDRSSGYVSGVFRSSKDVYLKAAAYNFSQAWFKVRG
ncbi:MAG: carboxypeptidase-like regulatory domain-containing protein, partial [Bacteroidetes bacterium]|nr:carboxypeptidase-like regulatory domain-containing protein [Bacteroidota bacterium]